MTPLNRSNNIAARMGRWSASHWKTAVFGWLAFVVAALVVGNLVGQKNIDQNDTNVGQSKQADHIPRDAGFQSDPQTEIVLIQNKHLSVDAPAFRVPPGWYPDPLEDGGQRWWDGMMWTEQAAAEPPA